MVDKVIIWAPILAGVILAIAVITALIIGIICCRRKKNGKNTPDGGKLGTTDAHGGDGDGDGDKKSGGKPGWQAEYRSGRLSVDELSSLDKNLKKLNRRVANFLELTQEYGENIEADDDVNEAELLSGKSVGDALDYVKKALSEAEKAGKKGKAKVDFDYTTVAEGVRNTRKMVVAIADGYVNFVEKRNAKKIKKLDDMIANGNAASPEVKVAGKIHTSIAVLSEDFLARIRDYRKPKPTEDPANLTDEAVIFTLTTKITNIEGGIDDLISAWDKSAKEGEAKNTGDIPDLEGSDIGNTVAAAAASTYIGHARALPKLVWHEW